MNTIRIIVSIDESGRLFAQFAPPPAGPRVDAPPVEVPEGGDYYGVPYADLAAAGPGDHDFPEAT